MKIAVVIGDDVVGDEPVQLCSALAARGHDVIFYVRQGGRRRPEHRVDPGYRTVCVCVGPSAARSPATVLPFVGDWAATLQEQWSSAQPDVVHAYGWLGGLAAQLAARQQGRPIVQSFHSLAASAGSPSGDKPVKEVRERIERLLARNASWVTVESTSDLDSLARVVHSRARVSVLTDGVDVEHYSPVGPAFDSGTNLHRILCMAPNPMSDNGFDTAVKVLPRVRAAELVVAETDSSNRRHDAARAKLKRLASDLGVADRVRFLGAVPGDRLPMLLRSVDVLVCTPRQPPRATATLQAMASGVAVVSLPVGVLTDVVVADVTGLLLSADDAGELAAALRELAAERFRCGGMGAAGRSRAMSRYTWDRIALDALAIYGKLSAERLLPTKRGGAMEEFTR
ncbi:glycosyl transferase family 1 [Mycobacterium sp. 1100029.7]|nr:glycosyl transferase family 1 [Mycobacterium sp. 1100029.7]